VEEQVGALDLQRVYLIGNSPYDVACAVTLGLRGVAVASGEHAMAELAEGGPWWTVDRMPSPEDFFARLGLPAGAELA
jgi:phosphoglycolate phosphatase-like HAD superfamily hydrolase